MSLPIKSQSEDLGGEAVKNMNSHACEEQLQDSRGGPPRALLVDAIHRCLYLPQLIPLTQEIQTLVTHAYYGF